MKGKEEIDIKRRKKGTSMICKVKRDVHDKPSKKGTSMICKVKTQNDNRYISNLKAQMKECKEGEGEDRTGKKEKKKNKTSMI